MKVKSYKLKYAYNPQRYDENYQNISATFDLAAVTEAIYFLKYRCEYYDHARLYREGLTHPIVDFSDSNPDDFSVRDGYDNLDENAEPIKSNEGVKNER